MKVFDTDLLVAYLRGHRDARAWFQGEDDPVTTVVNVAELHDGAVLSRWPEKELARVDALLDTVKILPLGPRSMRAYRDSVAPLWSKGLFPGTIDALVAAAVLGGRATLVTRNAKNFAHVPGLLVEAW